MNVEKLIFVYNADSDLFSSITDFAHKILSPSTYNCKLCVLTFGNISMKKEWGDFIKSLGLPCIFLHRDEFVKQYNREVVLPAIFYIQEDAMHWFLNKQQIEQCRSLDDLMKLLSTELSKYD